MLNVSLRASNRSLQSVRGRLGTTPSTVAIAAISAAAAAAWLNLTPLARGDVNATWDGTSNNWSAATHWSSNPYYPNNGTPSGALYDAGLQGGTITLDVSPTLDAFDFTSGNLTGTNTVTVNGSMLWTEGTITGATIFADGGLAAPIALNTLSAGNLTIASGTIATLGGPSGALIFLSNGAAFNNAGTTILTNGAIEWDGKGSLPNFNNSGTLDLNPPSGSTVTLSVPISNSGALNVQSGSCTLFPAYTTTPSGALTISSGATLFENTSVFQTNSIVNNGTFTLHTVHASVAGITGSGATVVSDLLTLTPGSGVSYQASLKINSGDRMDLTNNEFLINYGANSDPVASVVAWINSGYNNGAWNGPGITSSTAATTPGYGLGYADSADPGNPAGLSSGTIEIKYTLLGDANLDGVVNGVDFGILAANFNKGVTGWDKGDFNYDNVVSGIDFADLATNFNHGASGASFGPGPAWTDPALVQFAAANGLLADVPEPASLALLVLGTTSLLTRRRRRS